MGKALQKAEATLKAAGYRKTYGGDWEYTKFSDPRYKEHLEEGRKSGADQARAKVAQLVIAAFGIGDRYPDETQTLVGRRPVWSGGFLTGYVDYDQKVTQFGYLRLLDDLETVAAHADASSARERLFGPAGKPRAR